MNKLIKLKPIIINIHNSLCDFGTELPINDITNVIETNTFQSRSYCKTEQIKIGNLISDSNLTFQLSNITTSSNIDTIVEDVNDLSGDSPEKSCPLEFSPEDNFFKKFLVGNTSMIHKQSLRSFITWKRPLFARTKINISVQMDDILFQPGYNVTIHDIIITEITDVTTLMLIVMERNIQRINSDLSKRVALITTGDPNNPMVKLNLILNTVIPYENTIRFIITKPNTPVVDILQGNLFIELLFFLRIVL